MKQFDYVPSLSDWLGTLNWNSGRFIGSACGTTFTQMRLGDGPRRITAGSRIPGNGRLPLGT